MNPYPYQEEGILYGLEHKRLIIGDEPGLGKTLQAIGIVDTADAYPCLVICPSSLKINWQREFEKFTDKSAVVLNNSISSSWPYMLSMSVYQAAIVNYESLRKYFVWDIDSKTKSFRLKDVVFNDGIKIFKSIIIDESHRVKDASAQQTIFTKGLSIGKEYVILLSGTPVVNHPVDLVSQLSIMDRLKEFGGRSKYVMDYCPMVKGGETNVPLSDLSRKLYERCLIRREKAKVLKDLPAKTRVDLYLDIDNRDVYELAAADLAAYLRDYKQCSDQEVRRKMRMKALVRFSELRKLSAEGKLAQGIDFIKTFLESGQKLIVFCSTHEIIDKIHRIFPDALTITSRETTIQKQAAVDSFQTNPNTRLILCGIKAAGVGHTLTAASNVAFMQLAWTYADCCQCEDRAHRIGQKDNVTCYYLLGRHTIDHTIYNLINQKKSIAAEIMGSDDEIPSSEEYFDELVNNYLYGRHQQNRPEAGR